MRLPQYEFAEMLQKWQHDTAPHPALRATLPKGEGFVRIYFSPEVNLWIPFM